MSAFTTDPDELEAEIRELPITSDPIRDEDEAQLTPGDRDLRDQAFFEAPSGNMRVVRRLKELSRKYPEVASLKNHLSVAYNAAGEHRLADKVNDEIIAQHPDYLFGRINQAARLLDEPDEIHRIPEILGDRLRLRDRLPDADRYHVSQIRGFYHIVALFHLHSDRPELSKRILEILQDIVGPNEAALVHLNTEIGRYYLEKVRERMEADDARAISVEVPVLPGAETPQDFFPPGFRHPEIEALYRHEFDIPPETIEAILALPHDSLAADLEALLADSMARGPLYHGDQIDRDPEETCFPLHAILFLGEIGARHSLPGILDLLSQPEEILVYWFGDTLESELWLPLHLLARDQLDAAADWILSPGIPARSREVLGEAIAQIALHQPERRDEILDWFRRILEFLLDSPPEDNILDTHLVSGLVSSLCDIRAVELRDLIEKHVQMGLIFEMWLGDMKEIDQALSEPDQLRYRRPLSPLVELYPAMAERYSRHFGPDAGDFDDDDLFRDDSGPVPPSSSFLTEETGPPDTLPGPARPASPSEPKIGRNEPCPCGSGKKYKKCCL